MSMISKIDVWGDSILKGVILDEAAGRYRLLKDGAVNAFAQLFHLDIKNHSHFGCTAPKALANLDRTLRSGYDSDIVLLEFGGNDCDFNWAEVSKDPSGDHKPHTSYEDFVDAMQNMIRALLEKGIKPVLMSLPPIDSEMFFAWITRPDNVDPDNVLAFIGEKDFIYRHQERYSRAITQLAYENKLPLIDVRDVFLRERFMTGCLCADGIHPNEKGQKMISDEFAARYLEFSMA